MKVSEFKEYILKHMTADEALTKLLESSLVSYEKLKFDSTDKAVHPLLIISMAAMDMGWIMAIEKDEQEVRGIAVGTKEYMDSLFPPTTNPQP